MSKSTTSAISRSTDKATDKADQQALLPPARLAAPGFGWQTYEATLPADTPHEILTSGGFWRLCANRIQRGDHIKWRTDTLTRFGELLVVAIDSATGKMELRELARCDVTPATTGETEKTGFTPKDFGVHEKWGIVRDVDGHVMCRGIGSYDEAVRRIRVEYVPNLAQQSRQSATSKGRASADRALP